MVAVALLSLLAAGMAAGSGTPLPRADFAFCNQDEPSSLDPALATGFVESRVVGALFEGLTRLHPETLEPLPGSAIAWEVSDDGLSWRFTLRPKATWSNGDPLTAEDFRWSFLRLLDPRALWGAGSLLHPVAGARAYTRTPADVTPDASRVGLEAPRSDRLVITLERPLPSLPRVLAHASLSPVHRASMEQHGSAWIQPGKLVSNGPFVLELRRLKDRIRLARNPRYWGVEQVAFRTVDAYSANGVTTQLNLYLTGVVDWMMKPPAGLYDQLLPRPDASSGPQFGSSFLRFNVTRPALADARVRRALLLALDRRSLAADVLRGGRRPATSFVPEGPPGYVPAELAAGDPDAARALLAQAGYPGGEGLPPLELLYAQNASTRDLCEAVAETWRRELGVRTRMVVQAWKVYLDSSNRGLYDVASSSWLGDWLDAANFLDVFRSDGGSNRTGWADERYDALLDQAADVADVDARAALLAQAERLLLDEAPIAPLVQRVNINMVSPRVTGFHDNLLDLHPLRDLGLADPLP